MRTYSGLFSQTVGLLLAMLVFSGMSATAVGTPQVEFESLRFFEGPSSRPSDPEYLRVFGNGTRYVWCNLHVKNKLYNQRENPVKFRFRYFNPDGSFRGESSVDYTIPSSWSSAYLYAGWGSASGTSWSPGEYRVEAYYFDENGDYESFDPRYDLMATRFFKVAPSPSTTSIKPDPTISVYRIRFFEGPSPAPSISDRVFSDRFPKTKTRMIWTELRTINHLYGVERNQPRLELDYLNPDGSLRGTATINMNADPGWRRVISAAGWGWQEIPGNWPAGDYTVVVRENERILGKAGFTIEDDRPISLAYTAVDIRILRLDRSGQKAGNPGKEFDTSATHGIRAEFKVFNPNRGVREHAVNLDVELFVWDQGIERILDRQSIPRTFIPSEASAPYSMSYTAPGGKTLEPGRYGLRILLGDRILNMDYFAVK